MPSPALTAFLLQIALGSVAVTDGDTLHDNGRGHDYRLHGIDTPETLRAKCPAERALGEAAAARVGELLASAGEVRAYPAWEPRGRTRWPTDGFGRRIARVEVDGRDLSTILLAEGHAKPYSGGEHPDWCGPAS